MASCSERGCVFPATPSGQCAHHVTMFAPPAPLAALAPPRNSAPVRKFVVDPKFKPKITIEPFPGDDPPHDLWCWHLPNGKKTHHGMVGLVRLNVAGYVKTLARYGVIISEGAVLHPPDPMPQLPCALKELPSGKITVSAKETHVEETRVETRTVEHSVTVENEPVAPSVPDLPLLEDGDEDEDFIPADPPEAKKLLEASLKVWGPVDVGDAEADRLMCDILPNLAAKVLLHRKTKATTDEILNGWSERNDFDRDPYGSLKDLWQTVFKALMEAQQPECSETEREAATGTVEGPKR